MRLDLTVSELFAAIDEVLGAGNKNDVALLYINCHGGVTAGIPWIEMRDGVRIPADSSKARCAACPGASC